MSADDPDRAATARAQDTDGDELLEFWQVARARSKVAPIPEWVGPGVVGTMVPQAWAFGDTPELADALLRLVLDGVKTATSTALVELEAGGLPIPAKGELSIVLDGRGHPGALIRTRKVRRVRFDQVDERHAAAEGEDDRTLATWRIEHERYWRRVLPGVGATFAPDLELVLEEFDLRYPKAIDH